MKSFGECRAYARLGLVCAAAACAFPAYSGTLVDRPIVELRRTLERSSQADDRLEAQAYMAMVIRRSIRMIGTRPASLVGNPECRQGATWEEAYSVMDLILKTDTKFYTEPDLAPAEQVVLDAVARLCNVRL